MNDPHAADQTAGAKGIDSRFIFSRKRRPLPARPRSACQDRPSTSGIPGEYSARRRRELHSDDASSHARHGSMSDLKRFFKLGAHSRAKRSASPARIGPVRLSYASRITLGDADSIRGRPWSQRPSTESSEKSSRRRRRRFRPADEAERGWRGLRGEGVSTPPHPRD